MAQEAITNQTNMVCDVPQKHGQTIEVYTASFASRMATATTQEERIQLCRERIREVISKSPEKALTPEDQAEIETKRAEAQAARLRQKYKAECLLEGDMWKCTFDSFETRDPQQEIASKTVRGFASKVPNVDRNLLLWGPTGVGKSHLAKAAMIYSLEKPTPVRCAFVECSQLGRLIKERKRLVTHLLGFEYLILDDIEKAIGGAAADWAYEAVYEIIDYVDSRGYPRLLATSRFPLRTARDEQGNKLKDDKGKLLQPGHEEYVKSDYLNRLAKMFFCRWIDGPNGRDDKYLPEPEYWWQGLGS
ncbi:MAG: hypothetical protein ABFD54_14965 [Armatimonadota bacterium]|nr:hypothetical protein [bacterium]